MWDLEKESKEAGNGLWGKMYSATNKWFIKDE